MNTLLLQIACASLTAAPAGDGTSPASSAGFEPPAASDSAPAHVDDPFAAGTDTPAGFEAPAASASGSPAATPAASARSSAPGAAEGGRRPGALTPLPPPPPPALVEDIERGPWRGFGYFAASLDLVGTVAGTYPAGGNVLSFGGGLEGGVRLHETFALGFGVQAQPHAVVDNLVEVGNDLLLFQSRPSLVTWDLGIGRVYIPTAGRLQPLFIVSGGISAFELFPVRRENLGGHVRGGVAVERWLSPTVGLEVGMDYRAIFLGGEVGHLLQGRFAVVVHW